jgi:hypothetical protein
MGHTPYQNKLIAKRDKRIVKRLLKGESETHIMAVEGADAKTVGDIRKTLKGQLTAKGKSPPIPYGLEPDTERIRANLGNEINNLLNKPLERWEISPLIGIPPVAGLNAAKAKPGRHDWKMSELSRLAKLGDKTFIELILTMAQPTKVGFDQQAERDQWNSMIRRFLIG